MFSNGWIQAFKNRQATRCLKSHREEGDADEHAIVKQLYSNYLRLSSFRVNGIFSAVEFGL